MNNGFIRSEETGTDLLWTTALYVLKRLALTSCEQGPYTFWRLTERLALTSCEQRLYTFWRDWHWPRVNNGFIRSEEIVFTDERSCRPYQEKLFVTLAPPQTLTVNPSWRPTERVSLTAYVYETLAWKSSSWVNARVKWTLLWTQAVLWITLTGSTVLMTNTALGIDFVLNHCLY